VSPARIELGGKGDEEKRITNPEGERAVSRLACLSNVAYLKVVTAAQKASLAEVVSVNPEIMHGTPCFTGTRVPVQTLLDYIEEGDTLDNFLRDFSKVTREQAILIP
jgi:uncharacterized protein (DUF433 family)